MSPGKAKLGVMGAVVVCEGGTVVLLPCSFIPWRRRRRRRVCGVGGCRDEDTTRKNLLPSLPEV